jgi:D-cysteine desulfhydrase
MFAHLPTPLERADRLGAALALQPGRLWVKRDDCTGLATGGNKARKLELLVADALARGCDVLVTAGGPQSNHARQTAAAAARTGLGCVLAFNSNPPTRTESNQLLDVIFGAERRFLGPIAMDDLNAAVELIAGELRAEGRKPYVIPVGGSSPLAARLGHERVLGIDVGAVADPVATVRRLTLEVARLRGLPAPIGEPRIRRDQIGDGYGVVTRACLDAIRLAARTEGLVLDPVYSGKAMAGLMALPPSELQARAIVFLATGGVPALFESRYEEWLSGAEQR